MLSPAFLPHLERIDADEPIGRRHYPRNQRYRAVIAVHKEFRLASSRPAAYRGQRELVKDGRLLPCLRQQVTLAGLHELLDGRRSRSTHFEQAVIAVMHLTCNRELNFIECYGV